MHDDEFANRHRASHLMARSLDDLLAGGASRRRTTSQSHGAI